MFWPYHCIEEEDTKPVLKTASKSDVGNALTCRRGYCPRAQMRATRHTRLLHPDELSWPDPNTRRPDPHGWPGKEWRQHDIIVMSAYTVGMSGMTSSWCNRDVIMHSRHAMSSDTSSTSQQPRQQSGTHLPHHQSRAELSRAVWEPSHELRDRISVANPKCNRFWDWIWAVYQARIVLIKS